MVKKLIIAFCGITLVTIFSFLLSIISPWLILISIVLIPFTVSYLIPSFYKCPGCGKCQESDIPILDKFSETSMTSGRITKSGSADKRYNTSYRETVFIKRGFYCEECGKNWKVTRVNNSGQKYSLMIIIGLLFFFYQLVNVDNLNLVPIPYFELILLAYSIICVLSALIFTKSNFWKNEGKEKWDFKEYIAISKDWQWLYGIYLYSWLMYDKYQDLIADCSELFEENKGVMKQYGFKSIDEIEIVFNLIDEINATELRFDKGNNWLIQNFKRYGDYEYEPFGSGSYAAARIMSLNSIDNKRLNGVKLSKSDSEQFLRISIGGKKLLNYPEMQELIRILEDLENPKEPNKKKKKEK